jgi:hypothetical protein
MIEYGVRYVSFAASTAALLWLAHAGIFPTPHPFHRNEYVIDTSSHSPRKLRDFFSRPDVIIALTWFFANSGTSLTLPVDFNTGANQVNAIGAGSPGAGGFFGNPCFNGGNGGNGGSGGAYAQILNYAGHSAGQSVPIQVGGGDTIFDSSTVLLAKAGSGTTGGQASASVGTTKYSGGNGGTGGAGTGVSGGGGGGGGGAAGPHGAGNNGGNGNSSGNPGAGATADAGNTAAGANGTQFPTTPPTGSGGGGTGGFGGQWGPGQCGQGTVGGNSGSYGGGGGGGGGQSAFNQGPFAGGNSFEGLIAIGYTPVVASPTARSYGFVLF